MDSSSPTQHVQDSIQKVDDEIAIGSDLAFQRKWWRFERAVWMVFTIIIVMDLLGFFGRGYFAKVQMRANDGTLLLKYERIERYSAPSIMTVQFGPAAIHDGRVQLWVNESVVKALGNQRIIPEPASSVIGQSGILYTFPATRNAASAEFALEPTAIGISRLMLGVPGAQQLKADIWVMP
jgi:hypothetical protein